MQLRHGVTVDVAVKVLDDIISRSQDPYNEQFSTIDRKRTVYLNWVSSAQAQLRSIFADSELELSMLERGYWHICNAVAASNPLGRLINEEIEFQAGYANIHGDAGGRLGEARNRLVRIAALGNRPGKIYILDTNALLHYTRFDQFDWVSRLGSPQVRLIIPIVVIDELDAKKYARREEFRDRARELLTLIDGYATQSGDGYAQISDGVTLEVLPDGEGHIRAPSPDQEILERCEFIRQITGRTVTQITGDSGARISARSRGIEVFKLSQDDLLPRHKTVGSGQ